MKLEPKSVNKSDESPDGVEIQVVEAENDVESKLLCHLLRDHLKQLKDSGRLNLDLPKHFSVDYRDGGVFILTRDANSELATGTLEMYQIPRPFAVVLMHLTRGRFDLAYRAIENEVPSQPSAPKKSAATPFAMDPTADVNDEVEQNA